jgi:hypothetical protein
VLGQGDTAPATASSVPRPLFTFKVE